jgi:hypothetical protein
VSLATKRWVERRIYEESGINHPRRLGSATSSGVNWKDVALGFAITDTTKITITAGYLFHGQAPVITIAARTITITDDQTYIYVEYQMGSQTAAVDSSLVFPQNTSDKIRWLLYKVTLNSGVAYVASGNIYHIGNIYMPSTYAPRAVP